MRIRTALALIVSLAAFGLPASPPRTSEDQVHVSVNSVRYDISGDSVYALLEEMRENSPIVDNGKIYFGHTRSDMRWNYGFRLQKGGYAITSAEVAVEITFTLPRRVGVSQTRSRVSSEWERYLASLELHENGHADFAIAEAHRLHARLTAPRVFKTADALRKFVAAEGSAALAASREANSEYDADTNHGATQGTVLRWDPDSDRQQAHALNRHDNFGQSVAVDVH